MKVRLSNVKVMELYGAVLGIQKQASENDRRFNYAMERNEALLRPVACEVRRLDEENLKGYYEACDKEEAAAKAAGVKLNPELLERLKEHFKDGFEKNEKSMLEKREVVLYAVKFAWVPRCPGFMQRALGLLIEKPTAEELCQPLIEDEQENKGDK